MIIPTPKKGRILSFKYAFEGLAAAVRQEPNLKIHLGIAPLVAFLGLLLSISKTEWVIITILIGLVLTLELTNTAIEAVVDSFTDQVHPAAKLAKDISAAAVLTASFTAAVAGLMIFIPYLI